MKNKYKIIISLTLIISISLLAFFYVIYQKELSKLDLAKKELIRNKLDKVSILND